MEFFTSPEDLRGWVKIQESPDLAANKLLEFIGQDEEQDVVDTCREIFDGGDEQSSENASKILFGVLAKHNITQIKEGKMKNDKIKKEAQGIYRGEAAFYQSMPLRICPKLPATSNMSPSAKRVVSTMHCRENCLDSFTFDDDPHRVYCAEVLWRQHVMDKFSRAWRDDKGKLVGGYINERFQVYHSDGGNQMALAKDERVRKPRPHQYSTERMLEEGRGEKTYDLTASSHKPMVKLASSDIDNSEEKVSKIFGDIVEMREAGISEKEILEQVSDHYKISVFNVAKLQKIAKRQMGVHNGTVYACSSPTKIVKTAQTLPQNSTMVSKQEVQIIQEDGNPTVLKMETPVVMVQGRNGQTFEIVDGPDAGKKFSLQNPSDASAFGVLDDVGSKIQETATEVGLNEEVQSTQPKQKSNVVQPKQPQQPQQSQSEDFPIVEE